MSEAQAQTPALSQLQRLACIFSAPSRTFAEIRAGRSSWWLPLVLMALAGYLLFAAVQSQVGMRTVVENQIRMGGRAEQMEKLTPEQREKNLKISEAVTQGIFVASPVMSLLAGMVTALVLMATVNVGFGGKAKFGGVLAVWMYAYLPSIVKVLLGVAALYAGSSPELFNIKNFAPTNVGAFLNPMETSHALYALASSIDVVTIWILMLMSMGVATVAGVKRSAGYITVFGWWALVVLGGAAVAAIAG